MAASQSILEIIIQAVDESAAALQGAQNNLKQVGQEAIGTGAQIALAGAAILAPLGLSVEAAENSQKVQAQLGAVLKSTAGAAGVTADSALALSKALENQTTYSDEAVLSVENMLLTFTNIKDDVFPDATKAVLDMSVALGEDSKDSAIQLGKALQDPVLGVTALRRVGVAFTEDQRKLIETLVKSGDTLGAQRLILKEVTTEFGGSAAAAAGTFGGKVQQLNEKIDDMKETIGAALIPVLLKLVSAIAPIVDNITAWMEAHPKLTEAIVTFVAILGGLLVVLGTLLVILGTVAVAVGLLTAPVTIAIVAFAALAAVIVTYWGTIRDFIGKVWDDIVGFVSKHWQTIINILFPGLGSLLAYIVSHLDQISAAWNATWGAVSSFFIGIWDGVKNALTSALDFLHTKITDFINWATGVFQPVINAVNSVGNAASSFGKAVGGAVSGAVSNASSLLHLASGGIVSSPTIALVGEAGPEAVIPLSAFNNGLSLAGAGGTGAGNIIVNINGGSYLDSQGATMIANELAKQITRSLRVRNYAA